MRRATAGNAGEAAVLGAFLQRGLDVFLPFGGGHRCDLLVQLESTVFLRVQCKTAWPRAGCLLFNSLATDHGHGPRSYSGLADAFGVYFPPIQAVYLVPVEDVPGSEGRLRIEPARNNQRRRIRLAADYEIDQWSADALLQVAVGSLQPRTNAA